MIITIDGSNFNNYDEAYYELKKLITNGMSDENLAVSELIDKYLINNDTAIELEWVNSYKSSIDLGYKDTVRCYKRRLQSEPVSSIIETLKKIKDAENGKGLTIFEQLQTTFKEKGIKVHLL